MYAYFARLNTPNERLFTLLKSLHFFAFAFVRARSPNVLLHPQSATTERRAHSTTTRAGSVLLLVFVHHLKRHFFTACVFSTRRRIRLLVTPEEKSIMEASDITRPDGIGDENTHHVALAPPNARHKGYARLLLRHLLV
jgi:hypothetical protein